jgi:hypothetical protein
VTLDGTPLSDCLEPESGAADIQAVGTSFLAVAAELAPRARSDREAALKLGYLVGASRRGAARTQGIHSELVRRLEQETDATVRRSPAYREGERAGRSSG